MTKNIQVIIIDYPNALQSAVFGLKELFLLANRIIIQNQLEIHFMIDIVQPEQGFSELSPSNIVILPPNLDGDYYNSPRLELIQYLNDMHQMGAILCSACAGAFILAHTGLIDNRTVTTHWQLENKFNEQYPQVTLKIESLLLNDCDIISAGGLMSWIDLGLEIVAQFATPHIMRMLGKYLIVDTGKREQRYYASFTPKFNHGNKAILRVQHYIQTNYHQALNISVLADLAYMGERTFLRQFTNSTSLKPGQYIQRVRMQKACNMLESTSHTLEQIALTIGYGDVNSFRKIFIKVMGLSPKNFRAKFV